MSSCDCNGISGLSLIIDLMDSGVLVEYCPGCVPCCDDDLLEALAAPAGASVVAGAFTWAGFVQNIIPAENGDSSLIYASWSPTNDFNLVAATPGNAGSISGIIYLWHRAEQPIPDPILVPHGSVTVSLVIPALAQAGQPSDADPGPANARITPTTATFDRIISGDISVTLHMGGFTLRELRLGNDVLVRDRDYTVDGNRLTINEAFLQGLELGRTDIIFVMSGGANPRLQITVTQDMPYIWVEPSDALVAEWRESLGGRFDDLEIIVQPFLLENMDGEFVSADISFVVGNELLSGFAAYYTIFADLEGFVAAGQNYHRIVALQDGTMLGGGISQPGMIFAATATEPGIFTVAYIENLRRLSLNVASPNIIDLAGNIPPQAMDVLPVIQDGRTLIPIRFVAQALGAAVDWTPATADRPLTIHIILSGQTLSFGIGEITPGLAALGMDVPAQMINSRTMVPLRFVSEFFGAVVNWDAETMGIEITTAN